MRKIVSIFVKYPFYAKIIIAFLVIGGGFGFLSMKKSFFPERASRDIYVTVFYPGASPKEMEEGITTRVEEAVRGIVGIKEINSTSSEDSCSIQITTTGEYDLDDTLMEVKNAVDGISAFPVAAERPIVFKQRAVTPAMYMALSGNVDLMTLKKYANQIENDILSSGVVTQVQIFGLPPLEISVEVTEENLLRHGLTFDEISLAIARNNRDISAGMIKSDEEEVLIRSRSRSVNPNLIGDIVLLAKPDGSQLRIRDIGIVKTKFADVSNKSLLNGKQAVYFGINKLKEEDLDEVSDYMHNYVDEFNARSPGVKLHITFDFLPILKSRLNLMYRNGGIGLFLVVVALGLFLSTRLSLWVAWGIPASFLAMFVLAVNAGVTINMMSLFGMILVIGILVDDGIVIGENIYTHFEKGKSPRRAAIDGTMEVLPAVFTSVTTTIIAFAWLLFMTGQMEMMHEMAFVVIFSLLFSLLEAFFVLPSHVGSPHILRSRNHTRKGAAKIRQYLDKMVAFLRHNVYGRLLRKIIQWKWIVVTVPIALFIITMGLFVGGFIKYTIFPPVTFDFFHANIAFKPGSGEKQTMQYLQRFDQAIWEVNKELKQEFNDPDDYVRYTTMNLGNAFDGQESGAHAGNVMVILRDMEDSPVSSFEIRNRVRQKIGEVPGAEKLAVGGRQRFGKPVSVSLLGSNLEALDGAKAMLMEEMQEIDTINDITDTNAIGKREVRLKLKPKAYFLGLDHSSISSQVRQGFYGGQVQRLQSGRDELRVWVRYPKKGRQNLGQLETMKIKTPRGEYPLSELADYEIQRGPVNIKRYNSSREVRVEADLVDPYTPVPPILAQIHQTIIPKIKTRYPDIRVAYQGQQRVGDEAMRDMSRFFLIAFALIVLLLMIHFKSFSQPIIILMMIPVAWVGASWGHGLEGLAVSMLSLFGMVALSGVIINDAVVFLSRYNSNLLEGMSVEKAAYEAGIARFRAILLTSITTVAGLYPIVLEGSFQAQFLKPMAVALAYGVLFGTFFILLFFPALILVLNDLKVAFKWLWSGKKPEKRVVETAVIDSQVTLD
jgi:multidrug efflux pump subunit AcrB